MSSPVPPSANQSPETPRSRLRVAVGALMAAAVVAGILTETGVPTGRLTRDLTADRGEWYCGYGADSATGYVWTDSVWVDTTGGVLTERGATLQRQVRSDTSYADASAPAPQATIHVQAPCRLSTQYPPSATPAPTP